MAERTKIDPRRKGRSYETPEAVVESYSPVAREFAIVPYMSTANPFPSRLESKIPRLQYQAKLESALGNLKYGFRQSALLPGSGIGGVASDFGRRLMSGVGRLSATTAGISFGTIGALKAGLVNDVVGVSVISDAIGTGLGALSLTGNQNRAGISWLDAFRNKFRLGSSNEVLRESRSVISGMGGIRNKGTLGQQMGMQGDLGGVLSASRLPEIDEKRISTLENLFDAKFKRHNIDNLVKKAPKVSRRRVYGVNSEGNVLTERGRKAFDEAVKSINKRGFYNQEVGDKIWHQAHATVLGAHLQDALGLAKSGANVKLATGMRRNVMRNILGGKVATEIGSDFSQPVVTEGWTMSQAAEGIYHRQIDDVFAKGFDLKAHLSGKTWTQKEINTLREALIFNNGEGGILKKIANAIAPNYMSGSAFNSNEAMKILDALPEHVRRQVMGATTRAEYRSMKATQDKIEDVMARKMGIDAKTLKKIREPNVATYFQMRRQEQLIRRVGRDSGKGAADLLGMAVKPLGKEFAAAGLFGGLDLAFNISQINAAEDKIGVMDATVSGMYTAAVGAALFGGGAFGTMVLGGSRVGASAGAATGRVTARAGVGLFNLARRLPGTNLIINPAMKAAGKLATTKAYQSAATWAAQNTFLKTAAPHVAARGGIAGMTGAGIGRVVGAAAGLGTLMAPLMVYDVTTALADAAYQNEMMKRETIAQFSVSAHLSTPEAKMILTTERQKASMFARQAGMNFVAAQGEEAILFHQ